MAQEGVMTKGQIVDQLVPWAEYFKMRAKHAKAGGRLTESMQNMVWSVVIVKAMRELLVNETTEDELRKKFPVQMSSSPPTEAEEQISGE